MSDPYVPTTEEVRRDFANSAMGIDRKGRAERFDRWLAGVRADQAEADAVIAQSAFPGTYPTAIASRIRRAVALTPTTEETEQ